MGLNPSALSAILPPTWFWPEVAEFDLDPSWPLGPVVIHPRQLQHEEASPDLLADGRPRSVGEDNLVIEFDDGCGRLVLPRNEVEDMTVISASVAGGGQPIRLGPVRAEHDNPITDRKFSGSHSGILADDGK